MTDRTVMSTPNAGQSPASSEGLRADGIIKLYAGVPALAGVNITVRPGEIVGLVGHNGAGKSTLLKTLSGAIRPDSGQIMIDGQELVLTGPSVAIAAGISTVYQELSLLPNLTVTQNVFLGRELRSRGQLARESMRQAAQNLVDRFGVEVEVDRRLGDYPVATRQLLEIAIATERGSRFLLLDEPTTSLEGEQISRLLEVVRNLARESGFGVLLVNHKLDELYAVADSVVALVDGHVRISGSAAEVDRADIIRAIAGEEAAAHIMIEGQVDVTSRVDPESPKVAPSSSGLSKDLAGPPSFLVKNLKTPTLSNVTVKAYPGRVLGLYGLIGSGRTEFMRALVGLDTIFAGSIELDGQPFVPKNPNDAAKKGVVYLTEERKIDGIVPGLNSSLNVVLPILRSFSKLGALDKRAMSATATQYMDLLKVRGNRDAPVVSLSGGNQQKVLLARALAQEPKYLLLDEPTKGVDIGVKTEIHRLLRRLAHEEGLTVIVVSSEEEEILEVSDDVATFSAGTCDGRTNLVNELTLASLRRAAWDAS